MAATDNTRFQTDFESGMSEGNSTHITTVHEGGMVEYNDSSTTTAAEIITTEVESTTGQESTTFEVTTAIDVSTTGTDEVSTSEIPGGGPDFEVWHWALMGVGVALVVAAIVLLVIWMVRRRRAKQPKPMQPYNPPAHSVGADGGDTHVKNGKGSQVPLTLAVEEGAVEGGYVSEAFQTEHSRAQFELGEHEDTALYVNETDLRNGPEVDNSIVNAPHGQSMYYNTDNLATLPGSYVNVRDAAGTEGGEGKDGQDTGGHDEYIYVAETLKSRGQPEATASANTSGYLTPMPSAPSTPKPAPVGKGGKTRSPRGLPPGSPRGQQPGGGGALGGVHPSKSCPELVNGPTGQQAKKEEKLKKGQESPGPHRRGIPPGAPRVLPQEALSLPGTPRGAPRKKHGLAGNAAAGKDDTAAKKVPNELETLLSDAKQNLKSPKLNKKQQVQNNNRDNNQDGGKNTSEVKAVTLPAVAASKKQEPLADDNAGGTLPLAAVKPPTKPKPPVTKPKPAVVVTVTDKNENILNHVVKKEDTLQAESSPVIGEAGTEEAASRDHSYLELHSSREFPDSFYSETLDRDRGGGDRRLGDSIRLPERLRSSTITSDNSGVESLYVNA